MLHAGRCDQGACRDVCLCCMMDGVALTRCMLGVETLAGVALV